MSAVNNTIYAQWTYIPLGYLEILNYSNGTSYGTAQGLVVSGLQMHLYWKNTTDRTVTVKYSLTNKYIGDGNGSNSGSYLFLVSPESFDAGTYLSDRTQFAYCKGSSSIDTGTYDVPSGYCVFIYQEEYGRGTFTLKEE